MAEYIEREALKAEFMKHYACEYPAALVMAIIDNVSTADVAEVRHGKWIYNTDDFTPAERCSACGYNKPMIAGERTRQEPSNYCSNCGTKMDLE